MDPKSLSDERKVDALRRALLVGGSLAALATQLPLSGCSQAQPPADATPSPSPPPDWSATMGTFTTKDGTEIYYKDWGSGPIVTFSHGWPLSLRQLGSADVLHGIQRLSRHRA